MRKFLIKILSLAMVLCVGLTAACVAKDKPSVGKKEDALLIFSATEQSVENVVLDKGFKSFVKFNEIPTKVKLSTGRTKEINNKIGYSGDAIMIELVSGAAIKITLDKSLESIYDNSEMDTVTFTYLLTSPIIKASNGDKQDRVVADNEGEADTETGIYPYYSMFTAAGEAYNHIPTNEWKKVTISKENFLKAMKDNGQTVLLTKIYIDSKGGTIERKPVLYLGDITFSKK